MKKLMLLAALSSVFFSGCDLLDSWFVESSFSYEIEDIPSDEAHVLALITGQRYYISGNGSDTTGDGTEALPWRTVAKAQSVMQSGDGVILGTGSYGDFTDNDMTRDKYTVFIAATGATPTFTSVTIRSKYVCISGFRIVISFTPPSSGDTGYVDPQLSTSTGDTYVKSKNCVDIQRSEKIRIYNCYMAGYSKYLTDCGVYIVDSKEVVVSNCEITKVHRGETYVDSVGIKFYYNYIHAIAGTAFHSGGINSNVVYIEGNNVHDSNFTYTDDYCPRARGGSYHGAAVSFRNSNMVIRNNIFHNGFHSAGIINYDDTDEIPYFSNITIENNLLYDIRSYYCLRLIELGTNIVIRNNTFIGHYSATGNSYSTVFAITSLAPGYNGTGIYVHNNIFMGQVTYDSILGAVSEGNNMYYNCQNFTNEYLLPAQLPTSMIRSSGGGVLDTYYEDSFFVGTYNGTWLSDDENEDGVDDVIAGTGTTYGLYRGLYYDGNPKGHGVTINYNLSATSGAINFGDPSWQPVDALGTIDANGFIVPNTVLRSETNHNAGAY